MENQKKILVAYYSKTGNTERVAKDIASGLGADLEKIIDQKDRSGIFGFILGGRDAMKKRGTKIGILNYDPAGYDLIVVGTPVWGSNIAPAVRTYLDANRGKIKSLACFETSGGTPIEKIGAFVEEAAGKKIVAKAGFEQKDLREEKTYKEKVSFFVEAIKKL